MTCAPKDDREVATRGVDTGAKDSTEADTKLSTDQEGHVAQADPEQAQGGEKGEEVKAVLPEHAEQAQGQEESLDMDYTAEFDDDFEDEE